MKAMGPFSGTAGSWTFGAGAGAGAGALVTAEAVDGRAAVFALAEVEEVADVAGLDAAAGCAAGAGPAALTIRVAFMPAALWPSMVHSISYVPGLVGVNSTQL